MGNYEDAHGLLAFWDAEYACGDRGEPSGSDYLVEAQVRATLALVDAIRSTHAAVELDGKVLARAVAQGNRALRNGDSGEKARKAAQRADMDAAYDETNPAGW